jgi:hypothetical protein
LLGSAIDTFGASVESRRKEETMNVPRNFRVRRPIVLSLVAAAGLVSGTLLPGAVASPPVAAARSGPVGINRLVPHYSSAVAHDATAPLRVLAARAKAHAWTARKLVPERGAPRSGSAAGSSSGDAAVQSSVATKGTRIFPIQNFNGINNEDNFDTYGFHFVPPDPNGDVGRTQYVEMVNVLFSVYSKTGKTELGPTPIGALWQGFKIPDCTDASGDPIVLYDQLANRWILTQFTTRGLAHPRRPFYNCVAISKTADATGGYYRYAFTTGFNFPDYPKYGVWSNAYVATTREFGPTTEYGIGVYGLEKSKMLQGKPARSVSFFINGNKPKLLPLVGDGLLPADVDGNRPPPRDSSIPLLGSQDDNGPYGAQRDALNVWDFRLNWRNKPTASLTFADQLPVAPFDTDFPCAPDSRDCLPQPGITNHRKYLDSLISRQRLIWRLSYRNFGGYESLVANQSVEARPHIAGERWYEVRRNLQGAYSVAQQGTYAPRDGINRWMGSIAQDKLGNLLMGYSVVNGTDIFPGIRFTGRFAGDAPGKMTLHEGIIINGTGVQLTHLSRWGDYSAMTVDPVDDCTMWYVNEYYTAKSQATSPYGWLTRIASLQMPGCS